MIRTTLPVTKAATFCLHLPDPRRHGFPMPRGTGFFISSDGWFLTAAHVITEDGTSNGRVRKDIGETTLMKETLPSRDPLRPPTGGEMCNGIALEFVDPVADIAILKVDKAKNVDRDWFKQRGAYPYISVATRILDDGENVYSFGYPLSQGAIVYGGPEIIVGDIQLSPRVTSAIVSSNIEKSGMITESGPPLHYVLDKALNYGNSGGPIVAATTGHVHAFCSRFQPVLIPQGHLRNPDGSHPLIMIPSLYGVVVNLGHPRVVAELKRRSIGTISD